MQETDADADRGNRRYCVHLIVLVAVQASCVLHPVNEPVKVG